MTAVWILNFEKLKKSIVEWNTKKLMTPITGYFYFRIVMQR